MYGKMQGATKLSAVASGALHVPNYINVLYGSAVTLLTRPVGADMLCLRAEAGGPWRLVSGDRRAKGFTADAGSNLCTTSVAHEFVQPDGPLKVSTSGTLPGGLTNTALYWVRVASDTTFTLHSSMAGAMENTDLIDITDAGSGNQTIGGLVASAPAAAIADGYGSFLIDTVSNVKDWLVLAAPTRVTIVGTGGTDVLSYFWA